MGKEDPENPLGKEAAERQGLWANNLLDRRTAAPLPCGGSARQGRGRALGPPWQEEQERQVPGGTGRPGDSHDGNLPFPFSKPQTSCLPTWSAQPASRARAGPRGICIQMGFFQYSWFVTNGVKLLPSVTCSCPQARPGQAEGCGWSTPAPRPGSWAASMQRDHRTHAGERRWVGLWVSRSDQCLATLRHGQSFPLFNL